MKFVDPATMPQASGHYQQSAPAVDQVYTYKKQYK